MFRKSIHRVAVPAVSLVLAAGVFAMSAGAAHAQSGQPARTTQVSATIASSSPCPFGNSQCVDTGNGSSLALRPCPNTGPGGNCGRPFVPSPIRYIPDGTGLSIICQKLDGQGLNGNWGYTTIWDFVFDEVSNSEGYLFDGYVWTGSNGPVAGSC
jgi:hypothetical protein